MIMTGEVFSPCDYKEYQRPHSAKSVISDEIAIAFLAGRGYDISTLVKKAT